MASCGHSNDTPVAAAMIRIASHVIIGAPVRSAADLIYRDPSARACSGIARVVAVTIIRRTGVPLALLEKRVIG